MQLGFGFMTLPEKDGKVDKSKTRKLITEYMKGGKGYFDLASNYGTEEVFGELVASRYKRERYEVANKTPLFFVGSYTKHFEEQLERCKVDYFDYYFVHDLTRWNYSKSVFQFLMDKQREGAVKHIGISFLGDPGFLYSVLDEHAEIEVVQIELNYYNWEETGKELYDICKEFNKDIIAYQPFRGGMLLDLPKSLRIKDPVSYGMRFLADKDIDTVICGMTEVDHVQKCKDLIGAKPLTKAQREKTEKIISTVNGYDPTLCVQCGYCKDICPHGVPIKEILLPKSRPWNKYEVPPLGCVKCGSCVGRCPQHIDIRDELAR